MVTAIEPLLHEQLVERRHRLEAAVDVLPSPLELTRLLEEVDAALRRMDSGACQFQREATEPRSERWRRRVARLTKVTGVTPRRQL